MTINEYNSCVDQYADSVYRFILKNIRDEDMAKDVVQESFERMWSKVKNIEYSKSKSYLFTTAYHTMIDFIRKEKHMAKVEHFEDEAFTRGQVYSDLKEVLDKALAKLPEIQRSVLLLRDYEGYSYKEIGDITDLNESQVKVYIYRARIQMKNYIGKLENVI
jgi:RNA polymerase sigma-70 factor (ECF subfamily)